jgi:hypothetical protein
MLQDRILAVQIDTKTSQGRVGISGKHMLHSIQAVHACKYSPPEIQDVLSEIQDVLYTASLGSSWMEIYFLLPQLIAGQM